MFLLQLSNPKGGVMEIGNAYASGLQGYQTAARGITEATANINQSAAESRNQIQGVAAQPAALAPDAPNTPSVESQIVRLSVERLNGEANIRTIETADEVLGSLIDVKV